MHAAFSFLVAHGYIVVLAFVFAEQIGFPIPAVPVLLAAGALAEAGKLSPSLTIAIATAAAVLSDAFWYELGRRRGYAVLRFLCRISIEPDSCVKTTERLFLRFGARTLLAAKFLPGLSTAAPPLAGLSGMSWHRFLAADAAGSAIWAGAFVGIGYSLGAQLMRLADAALEMGSWLGPLLAGGLGAYIAFKYIQVYRVRRRLRIGRVTPSELEWMLRQQLPPLVVDLRHPLDVQSDPLSVPGARWIAPGDVEKRRQELPRDRDIIFFCT